MQNNLFYPNGISLDMVYNPLMLNLFSDASIISRNNSYIGCYGSLAVTGDKILEKKYILDSDTTVNKCEIKGIRSSLELAIKYADNFRFVNVFSDSQVSIFGLRDYIYKWKYRDNKLFTSSGKPAANQSIFIECIRLLDNPAIDGKINLFHQNGHINNSYDKLTRAGKVFMESNNIIGNIDLNLIRYISTYNDIVDRESRSILINSDKNSQYGDAISYVPKGQIVKGEYYDKYYC